MNAVVPYIPLLGIPIQWLRGKKSVPEWATFALQVVIGTVAHWLGTGQLDAGVGATIGQTILATTGASYAANLGVKAIPKTNSQ